MTQRSAPTRSDPDRPGSRRLLFRVDADRFELVDVEDVFFIAADGDDALVRTRRKQPYRSTERIAELAARLPTPPFFRVHRSHVVNLDRVRQVRRRGSRGWEVVLDPPVGAIVPVARSAEQELFRRLGRPEGP